MQLFSPDPEDALNLPKGVTYQQSVTMVAQLFPAIKAEPSNIIWGLPTLVWGILIGCSVLAVLSLTTVFLCCWLIPRSRKFLSPTRCSSTRTQVTDRSGPRISIHSTESAGEWLLNLINWHVDGTRPSTPDSTIQSVDDIVAI